MFHILVSFRPVLVHGAQPAEGSVTCVIWSSSCRSTMLMMVIPSLLHMSACGSATNTEVAEQGEIRTWWSVLMWSHFTPGFLFGKLYACWPSILKRASWQTSALSLPVPTSAFVTGSVGGHTYWWWDQCLCSVGKTLWSGPTDQRSWKSLLYHHILALIHP